MMRIAAFLVGGALLCAPALAQDPGTGTAPAPAQEPAAPAAEPAAPAPKAKIKKAHKKVPLKKPRPGPSRWKSTELTENTERHYRFDAEGNPIVTKKKVKAKPVADEGETPVSCSEEKPCLPKDPDADAL